MSASNVTRDKADEVKRRTKEGIALQRATQRNATEVTEEDIDSAVCSNIELVMSHRKDLSRLKEIEEQLLDELENNPTKLYVTQFQGEIVQETLSLTITEKSAALVNLSNVRAKRIEKQRQAFNIEDETEKTERVIVQLSEQDAKL